MNSVLTCSRYVVRAILHGVYNSTGGPSLADPNNGASLCSCSLQPPHSLNVGQRARNASSQASKSDAESLELTSEPRFLSVKSGFPKDMLHGPSTVREQEVFGDDACFIATHRSADVVGVADGVGGWHGYGIDPSLFARGLMRICGDLVRSGQFRPHLPAQLLASAYSKLQRTVELESENKNSELPENSASSRQQTAGEDLRAFGSSTACVVVLDKLNSQLHTANLGDSGFLVVRGGKVVYQSEEQIHYFNTPFQLSLPPKDYQSGRNFLSDSPESAETLSLNVQEGDIILVATDGLFDNLPTNLIESELAQLNNLHDENSLQQACNSLALQARRLAFDMEFMSPFAKKAQSYGIETSGGKPDDITVLLAVVSAEKSKMEQNKTDKKGEARQEFSVSEPTLPYSDLNSKHVEF